MNMSQKVDLETLTSLNTISLTILNHGIGTGKTCNILRMTKKFK